MSRGLGAGRPFRAGLCLALLLATGAMAEGLAGRADAALSGAPRAPETADASALYDAGTTALDRGDLGRAVAFLKAAERVEPRAPDIRRNLTEARARASAARGAETPGAPPAFRLSAPEAWWLSAILLLLAAILGSVSRAGRRVTLARRACLLAGFLLLVWFSLRAREESIHPEAVVVAPSLPAGPAPDERSRPPYLLQAGEEVRLGRTRGALVEIRVAGTSIGWAERSGVWRVADAPGYTGDLPRP